MVSSDISSLTSHLTMSSPDQNITISTLSTSDIPVCASLLSKSFGHAAPFVDIYFPGHDTTAGQAALVERLTTWKTSSPESTFLKAVVGKEGSDDVIWSFAIWTLIKDAPETELEKVEKDVGGVWPDKRDREFMRRLWERYVRPRSRVIEASGRRGVYGM